MSSTEALTRCRDLIGHWLVNAPIQARGGLHQGGIAGCLDVDGCPAYHYGEITGYWLHWAALYAPDADRMVSAVSYLAGAWAGPGPAATRCGAIDDWRNGAVFSFDLAMVLKGLSAAVPWVGAASSLALAQRIRPWLARLADAPQGLRSHLVLPGHVLPERWSTRTGPYQAKTAAALLAVPPAWVLPSITAAAQGCLDRWQGQAGQHAELHARFYALEGARMAGRPAALPHLLGCMRADAVFPEQAVGAASVGAQGSQTVCLVDVPPAPLSVQAQLQAMQQGGAEPLRRADVQAQALRLLCLEPHVPEATLLKVAERLLEHVRADGSTAFSLRGSDSNVWCALFAHQALDWCCARLGLGARALPGAASLV